jgi:predicted DNA-binding transcriptional regulator AlpA
MLHMGATLTALPIRDDLVREVLSLLGDGGTTDHARAVVAWVVNRFPPVAGDCVPTDLVGVNEVASILGTSRANVLRWSNGQGRTDFPRPVFILACGPHWSDSTVRAWKMAQDDIMNVNG